MCPPRHEERQPEIVDEFKGEPEGAWVAYIGEHIFKDLVPGAPFLLIKQVIGYDRLRWPKVMIERDYIVGMFADNEPLFIPGKDGFSLATAHYIASEYNAFSGRQIKRGSGMIACTRFQLMYTPIKEEFELPRESRVLTNALIDKKIRALRIACGIDAMEKLATDHAPWDKDFLSWYAKAILSLGLVAKGEPIEAEVKVQKVRVLEILFADLQSKMRAKNNLRKDYAAAVELGLHKESNEYRLECGLTVYPAQLLKDIEDAYPDLLQEKAA